MDCWENRLCPKNSSYFAAGYGDNKFCASRIEWPHIIHISLEIFGLHTENFDQLQEGRRTSVAALPQNSENLCKQRQTTKRTAVINVPEKCRKLKSTTVSEASPLAIYIIDAATSFRKGP